MIVVANAKVTANLFIVSCCGGQQSSTQNVKRCSFVPFKVSVSLCDWHLKSYVNPIACVVMHLKSVAICLIILKMFIVCSAPTSWLLFPMFSIWAVLVFHYSINIISVIRGTDMRNRSEIKNMIFRWFELHIHPLSQCKGVCSCFSVTLAEGFFEIDYNICQLSVERTMGLWICCGRNVWLTVQKIEAESIATTGFSFFTKAQRLFGLDETNRGEGEEDEVGSTYPEVMKGR